MVAKRFPLGRTFSIEEYGKRSWVLDGGASNGREGTFVSLMLCATSKGSESKNHDFFLKVYKGNFAMDSYLFGLMDLRDWSFF